MSLRTAAWEEPTATQLGWGGLLGGLHRNCGTLGTVFWGHAKVTRIFVAGLRGSQACGHVLLQPGATGTFSPPLLLLEAPGPGQPAWGAPRSCSEHSRGPRQTPGAQLSSWSRIAGPESLLADGSPGPQWQPQPSLRHRDTSH